MNEFYSCFINLNGLFSKTDSGTSSPPSWRKRATTNFAFAILLFSLLLSSGFGFAQSISNYAFGSGTNGNLHDLSTGTTSYLVGNQDDTAGTVQPLGFDFLFMGMRYTHFSANSNGQMRLHASAGESAIGTNVTPAAGAAILAPFGGDNEVGNGMRFRVIGTAPNRTFVLEWNQFYINWFPNLTNAGNMQAWLDETSGKITYMYGEIYNSSGAIAGVSKSIFIASSNVTNTVASVTIAASPVLTVSTTLTVNSIAAGSGTTTGSPLIANIGSAAQGSRVFFTFTPPVVVFGDANALSFSAITGNSSTLNWIDNATNEFGFLITRATDAAFTQNVVTSNVVSTTSAGTGTAYTSIQTGLSPSTNYFYRINALVEAGQSTGITGSQATLPPGNISAIATGLWSEATTWSTSIVPTATDVVTIPAGIVVTQDVTAAIALSLLIQGDLVFSELVGRTVTVVTDVTINAGASIKSAATGTVLTHSLVVGGSLINNGTIDFSTNGNTAGATITFNTAGNANFILGASSVTNLRNSAGVTLNKGTNRTNVLTFNPGGNLTVHGANALGFMVITNGLLQVGGSNTFSNPLFATVGYSIPSSAGYWQNNSNTTIVGLAGSPSVSGLLRISSGIFNVGTAPGNSMGFGTNSFITIEGGTVNAASRFGVASSGNIINYTQSGGIINVNQVGNISTTLASFDLGTNSTTSVINFTGGTVNVVLASTAASGPRDVRGTNVFLPNFAGSGIINFGTAASAVTPSTYFISGNVPALTISTTSAVHNLSLNATAQSFGNVDIPAGSTLNLNGFQFILRGTNVINNGTLTGTTAGSNLYFFAGTTPQSYSGSGVCTPGLANLSVDTVGNSFTVAAASSGLNPLRVNLFSGNVINSNKITIGTGLALPTVIQTGAGGSLNPGGSFDISPIWDLGTGTNVLIYSQESAARTSGFEVNPTRIVNGLFVDNTNGVTITGGTITTLNSLGLTNGIVTTGANTLVLGNATTVGTLTGGSATAYVNGALTRSIATANTNSTFVPFPIGKSGIYTPIALAPATTSIALFKAESFGSNTGTQNPSIIGLSTNRRFEALPVSGTFDNINVRLSDLSVVATNIPVQAPTAAGVYTNAFGSTAAFAAGPPISLTSTTPVPSATYTGFLSFANSNICSGTPLPGNTLASSNTICLGASVTLSLQNAIAGSGVTYQWQSSSNGVTYTDILGAIATTLVATPNAATFYRANVTCTAGPATGTSTAVQIAFANSVASTTPASRCGVGTVTLAATPSAGATISWYANATGGAPITSGNSFETPSISGNTTYFAAAEVVSPIGGIVGSGATTSTSAGGTFLPGFWGGAKTQYIIRASELIAAGVTAGNITNLGFEPTTSGQTYQGFVVQMGATAQTEATTTFIAGLTQVYRGTLADDGFTPVANAVNTLLFGTGSGSSAAFNWDGTSNIVVSISWSRVPGASTATGSGMKVDVAEFNATAWRQRDNFTPAAMLAETSAVNVGANRPRFIINNAVICSSPRVAVTASVSVPPAFTLSTTNTAICSGTSSTALTITAGAADYDTYAWSPSTGVSGNSAAGWVFNPTANTNYVLTASQSAGDFCATTVAFTVAVNPIPTAIAITQTVTQACLDAVVPITVSGGTLSNVSILNENFNGATNNWTTVNASTGSSPAAIAWTLRNSPFNSFISNDASQFYLSDNDAGGSGSTANTALVSPSFSTVNFVSSNVSFWHYFRSAGTAKVEYSIDNGTIWNTLQTFTVTTGLINGFVQQNIVLPAAALNQADVRIRFKYDTTGWEWYWAVDNVSVTGTQNTSVSWSPAANLFTDAAATVAYVANTNASTVYFKSNTAVVNNYTATASTILNCFVTATTAITAIDCAIPYANLQFPGTATIATCNSQTYFARVFKAGVTEAPGQGIGIEAWIGRNTANTDPATWTEASWQLATFNVQSGNDDEYQATFGPAVAGTYYVASRFVFAPGAFVYGGFTPSGGGIWNGTTNVSAVLTIEEVTAPTASAQSFCNTGTVANLVAVGTGIQWYVDATGGTALPGTTALVTGNYFASQTIFGCESTRTSVAVTVNVTAAPTASAQSFCNTGTVANLVAVGTGIQWYAAATGGTALTGTTALVTGNYFASQTIAGCESARTSVAVTVNVTAAPTASAQSFCSTGTVANLVAVGTGIQWYAAATGGTALAGTTALVAGNYFASQTIAGCEGARTSVAVTFSNNVVSTTPGTRCGLGTVVLNGIPSAGATLNWYANATGGTILGSGNSFTTPSIAATTTFFTSAATTTVGNVTLGAGATTSTGVGGTFLPGGWGGAKTQYIIRASELAVAGIAPGAISSLGFQATTSGQAYQGFIVQMGATTQTVATSTFVSGLTQVYRGTGANDAFTPVANAVNTLSFGTGSGSSNSFTWDGISNVVVSISWSVIPAAFNAIGSGMIGDNVGFVTSVYHQADNITPAQMLAVAVSTAFVPTGSIRPSFIINGSILCNSPRVPVVATVVAPPVLTLSATTATICLNSSSSAVTITAGAADYNTYVWSPSTGVSGNSAAGWVFNPTVNANYVLTASQSAGDFCVTTVAFTVVVNPIPSALVITQTLTQACLDTVVPLTVTGGALSNVSVLTENFNGATNSWTTINNTTDATNNAIPAWTLRPSGFFQSVTFVTSDASQFYLSNSDAAGFGNITDVSLISPSFSTLNFSNANLVFNHFYQHWQSGNGTGTVAYSINNGTTWINIQSYTADIGATNNFANANLTLPAGALNQPNVIVRFRHFVTWGYWWAIDNVSVTGTQNQPVSWSPAANLFTDAAATVAYIAGTPATSVFFKSSTAGVNNYTATATTAATCFVTATTAVTAIDCAIPYANLQFPGTATIATCNSQTYFARVFKAGVTEPAGPGAGIQAWIGRNTANTDPATWSEASWQLATFNVQSGNDDEYQATFGPAVAGTYYVASRFVFAPGAFVYGGFTPSGGGIWNGTINVSAVLTVEAVTAPTASAQSFCNTGTVANLVAVGTGIQWYASATGGTALAGTTALVTGNYFASQTIFGCESTRTSVAVTVNVTAAPTASAQSFCNTGTVANLVAVGTGIQWYAAATGGTALAGTTALVTGNYFASQTIIGCEGARTSVAVTVNVTAAPTGTALQDFTTGQTLANFTVVGQNIIWYSSATGSTVLPLSTVLVSGTIYYATQTVDGCQSTARLAVTAGNDLRTAEFEIRNLRYYPNPVQDNLTVEYSETIQSVQMYNMLGQLVYNRKTNDSKVIIEMTNMAAGNYIMQVTVNGLTKNVKVIKK